MSATDVQNFVSSRDLMYIEACTPPLHKRLVVCFTPLVAEHQSGMKFSLNMTFLDAAQRPEDVPPTPPNDIHSPQPL